MAKKKEAAKITVSKGAGPAVDPKAEKPSAAPKLVPAVEDMRKDGSWPVEVQDRLRKLKGNLKKAQADEEDLKRQRRSIEAEQEEDDSDELKIQWFDNRRSLEKSRAAQKWLTSQILATIEGADQGKLFKGEPVKPTEAMLFGEKPDADEKD